jgi:dihydrodipicolinate synthase/N-acetylneuraminate lyase
LSRAIRTHLLEGQVIPAHPLALDEARHLDERYQRALTRYYLDSGAGGIAVGVHTTQFEIRDHHLYEPVLTLAAETVRQTRSGATTPFALVAGVIGDTNQATHEAEIAVRLGYDVALLGLGSMPDATENQLIAHCRAIGEIIPLFGFYLQPAVGGRRLGSRFWRKFVDIPQAMAIKIAAFDRYETLGVIRAVAESGRTDVALYTGNDDNIVADLVTPFPGIGSGSRQVNRMVGGLLGHWAMWTSVAVRYHREAKAAANNPAALASLLPTGVQITDMNSAVFDPANAFRGCIPGIHEVLHRQGLMRGTWSLDPQLGLSPGQREEIDRVLARYPQLIDDAFVAENRDRWLS